MSSKEHGILEYLSSMLSPRPAARLCGGIPRCGTAVRSQAIGHPPEWGRSGQRRPPEVPQTTPRMDRTGPVPQGGDNIWLATVTRGRTGCEEQVEYERNRIVSPQDHRASRSVHSLGQIFAARDTLLVT